MAAMAAVFVLSHTGGCSTGRTRQSCCPNSESDLPAARDQTPPLSARTAPAPERHESVAPLRGAVAKSHPTFLGRENRIAAAVLDFEAAGFPAHIGQSVADQLRTRLPSQWFRLVERTQVTQLLQEKSLQASDLGQPATRDELARLLGAEYLILGSVTPVGGTSIEARLVAADTGEIVRQASAMAIADDRLEEALDNLAATLGACDAVYERIQRTRAADRDARLVDALSNSPAVVVQGGDLLITIKVSATRRDEVRVYQEVRQKVRELFAEYCRTALQSPWSRAELMSYCREREECDDVTSGPSSKTFVFRIPLPK